MARSYDENKNEGIDPPHDVASSSDTPASHSELTQADRLKAFMAEWGQQLGATKRFDLSDDAAPPYPDKVLRAEQTVPEPSRPDLLKSVQNRSDLQPESTPLSSRPASPFAPRRSEPEAVYGKASPFSVPAQPTEKTYGPPHPFGPPFPSRGAIFEVPPLPASRVPRLELERRTAPSLEGRNEYTRTLLDRDPFIYRLQVFPGCSESEHAVITLKNDILKTFEDAEFHRTAALSHLDDSLEKALERNELSPTFNDVFVFLFQMANERLREQGIFQDLLQTSHLLLSHYIVDSGVKTAGRNIEATPEGVRLALELSDAIITFPVRS